jgi:hypothetical protein
MSNKKITGTELILKVLESAKKPLSVSDIWDVAKKKGYAEKYAPGYAPGPDEKQKKAQIGSDICGMYQEENSPIEKFEKGEYGKDVTYSLYERKRPLPIKVDREKNTCKKDDRRKVSSAYCKRISYKNWMDKCKAKTPEGNDEFSIVYRVYSVSDGDIKYVGRSDRPFSRVKRCASAPNRSRAAGHDCAGAL